MNDRMQPPPSSVTDPGDHVSSVVSAEWEIVAVGYAAADQVVEVFRYRAALVLFGTRRSGSAWRQWFEIVPLGAVPDEPPADDWIVTARRFRHVPTGELYMMRAGDEPDDFLADDRSLDELIGDAERAAAAHEQES